MGIPVLAGRKYLFLALCMVQTSEEILREVYSIVTGCDLYQLGVPEVIKSD